MRKLITRLRRDMSASNPWHCLMIFMANIVPNLVLLKTVKSFWLKMAGVDVGLDACYIKSPILIDDPSQLEIGHGVFINHNVYFEGHGKIVVGNHSHIGPNVVLATTSHSLASDMNTTVQSILVKENVWIGANATLIGGIELGPNVIVAAGAVVTKGFSDCLIAGVPAKRIRTISLKEEGADTRDCRQTRFNNKNHVSTS